MTQRLMARVRTPGIAAFVAMAAGCHGLLDVESPGRIADSDLNNKDAIPGLVVGMSNRMANLMGGITRNMVIFPALVSGEMYHGGSYSWAQVPSGYVDVEDMGTNWGAAQVARWVAEDGIRRMRDQILTTAEFNANASVARAYVFAALANRTLGENMCTAVIDGGAAESYTVYFDRGIAEADTAITIGTAAGATAEVRAAYGARASMKAWEGDWAGAATDAQEVTPDFVLSAATQLPSPENLVTYETHNRNEYTVYSTFMSDSGRAVLENMDGPAWSATHAKDPRAPWKILYNADGSIKRGANGSTPAYQQSKYDARDSDIPLVKGTEMLVLRAEAALRSGDIPGAYILLNQARGVSGMGSLVTAADAATAWKDVHYERSVTTWLEGRHLWDSSRWFNESGPAHSDAIAGRDQCLPVSKSELDANRNLTGYTVTHPLARQ